MNKPGFILFCFLLLLSTATFGQKKLNYRTKINYRNVPVVDSAVGYASFYSDRFVGKRTSNGEIFSQKKLTCAHNTLPLGTMVRVTNLRNGRSVVVKVNDRLHKRNPRLVDLSKAAAKKIDFKKAGVIRVRVEVVK